MEPYEFKLARRVALSPGALGVVVAFVALVVVLGAYRLSGIALIIGSSPAPQAHAALLASALLGYCAGAAKYMSRNEASWPATDLIRSRWGGALGVLAGIALSIVLVGDIAAIEPERSLLNLGEVALNVVFLTLYWAVGRAGYFAVIAIVRPATVASVDLFDLAPLYRHGRDQLRMALVWLMGISLFATVMLFDPNPAVQVTSFKVAGPMLAGFVLLGLLLILLPLRRIWMALRAAKAEALASVMADLRTLRRSANAPAGREADLLARRNYFAALPEWPFDASSIGTFAFYVLLPFLTWAVGAVAKQVLDTVFVEKAIKLILGPGEG